MARLLLSLRLSTGSEPMMPRAWFEIVTSLSPAAMRASKETPGASPRRGRSVDDVAAENAQRARRRRRRGGERERDVLVAVAREAGDAIVASGDRHAARCQQANRCRRV